MPQGVQFAVVDIVADSLVYMVGAIESILITIMEKVNSEPPPDSPSKQTQTLKTPSQEPGAKQSQREVRQSNNSRGGNSGRTVSSTSSLTQPPSRRLGGASVSETSSRSSRSSSAASSSGASSKGGPRELRDASQVRSARAAVRMCNNDKTKLHIGFC